jgi:CRISPR-associated protein Cmr3
MNTILLEPTDVLFFRDGRPMSGSLSGHGAGWPMPNVISHALHAALHRAEFSNVHPHDHIDSEGNRASKDNRKFGSLVTAGPFPVCTNGWPHTWFFPHPADASDTENDVFRINLKPVRVTGASSLPSPLIYAVGSSVPPSKDEPRSWWSEGAWNDYLGSAQRDEHSKRPSFKRDTDFADTEHTYGIELSPDTGSVVEGQFYSASYLRLRAGWKLGVFATAPDKDYRHNEHGNDLVAALLNGQILRASAWVTERGGG